LSFKYDPFGRRIEKISPTTTSIFAYDGDNLVETVNGSGGEVASYADGLDLQDIDAPLAVDRSGTVDYYEQDGLNSVTSLTASNGSLAQSYTYDSFGNQTASSGSLTNFLRYTGREFDTETNLYYYRARYYDPSTGRFLSEDPLGVQDNIDMYVYVGNNAATYQDPKPCKEPDCIKKFADPSCPSCGANYFFLTTNSNYWVSNALRGCGLTPPSFLSAPGCNYDPEAWIAISSSQPQY